MQLSYSSIGTFESCPRCFWLDRNKKISRPRGIMSSMPGAVDEILKKNLEEYRTKGELPESMKSPLLEGFQLFKDTATLKKFRNWKTSITYTDKKGNVLVGAFDDLLQHPLSKVTIVLDYKTYKQEPTQEYCEKYYQKQINLYTMLLKENKFIWDKFGVLFYFWPEASEEGLIRFKSKTFFLEASPDDGLVLFNRAIECLELNTSPKPSEECEYCKYVGNRIDHNLTEGTK